MFGNRYDGWDAINLASQETFLAEERDDFRASDAAVSLLDGEVMAVKDSGDGVSSPPLWRTSPTRVRHRYRNSYRDLSPESRTQAIVRGQRELMEMVRNMPESCYELSLKDLVEHPMVLAQQEETPAEERDSLSSELLYRRELGKKKNQNNSLIRRDRRIDNGGFYLKMMFPLSQGSIRKKTKKNEEKKVAGRASVSDGSAKGVEKEWWKRRASVSCDSDSGGSSLNSGSVRSSGSSSTGSSGNGRSVHRYGSGGCWSWIITPRTAENQE